MERSIDLALNRFASIPASLRVHPSVNQSKQDIQINLTALYHHYYLDSYGQVPPDPDPCHFEYLRFLSNSRDFRLLGDDIGASTVARRHSSTELGQAFCRWFLHDHLDIVYFAHIEHIVNKSAFSKFSNIRLERVCEGDIPDYLCTDNTRNVYLAEAKGRYSAINFGSREFESWRRQFNRVAAKNVTGQSISLKGFIVGTRFATEQDRSAVKSRLSVEDPRTPGEIPADEDGDNKLNSVSDLGAVVATVHYGNIASKLNQPVMAAALAEGFLVPDEILFPTTVWESGVPPLRGKQFIGGYFPSPTGTQPIRAEGGQIYFDSTDPFRLDVGRGTFLVLKSLCFVKWH